MSDLNFQKLSTVQPTSQELPMTVASANVLTPVGFLTILTGNTVVKTINPPHLGIHVLAFVFAGAAGVDATANIATAKASVAGEVMLLVYNPINNRYYPVG
jgi:hypothetical protein